jgi:predicted transglutaminase-like cysteine proteinase
MMRTIFISIFILFCSLSTVVKAYIHTPWTEDLYQYLADTYDTNVEKRARYIQQMILADETVTEQQMITDVNNFFNQVQWVSDSLHWGQKDYWQTPLETLIEFKGDCEDIAIAKYTLLRVMGIPDRNLSLVYSFTNGVPHMVLAYYESFDANPYILDSLNEKLLRGDEREDIVPVYEFNSTTVWLTDKSFHKLGQGKPEHLALEDELKVRLANNRHLLQSHNDGQPVIPFAIDTL